MIEEERSAAARARAEQALVWVLDGLDSEETKMIVLGGLVPDVLSGGSEIASTRHLGTTDVTSSSSPMSRREATSRPSSRTCANSAFALERAAGDG
jgi:hypothetical protein